ncbi:leader peptidase (prepilin peptidase)/N-methyltransferase [Ereboglobus sp. PH5-10]|uniref:prepilin peptidase n=1 Tax=Ereboglobus sp. PH5-10 TaxID=2940629 RepID=UPI002405DB86|nr:A24 family peptidase [Ereboglobus sp. PH5-10]MDF9828382.1 leader peptidase (prepilin peptidase)/N-methyltransferase [Ereboglobus sp. PH5-10]
MHLDNESLFTLLPWLSPALVFLVGACIGSFLNVCIYRIPAGKSVVRPGSHCVCGKPIAWHDNIPILGWLVLRGRARCCGASVSPRYPFVELLTASLFLACWLLFPPFKALSGMLMVSFLICGAFIDIDHFELPSVFTIGLGIAGIILSCLVPSLHGQSHEIFALAALRSGLLSLQGLLIGSAVILWIALVAEALLKKEAMGFGDVLLVGGIGAFCGWQGAVFSIFGGAFLGLLCVALVFAWNAVASKKIRVKSLESPEKEDELNRNSHIPFGPMLAAGGLVYFLLAHKWIDPVLASINAIIWK